MVLVAGPRKVPETNKPSRKEKELRLQKANHIQLILGRERLRRFCNTEAPSISLNKTGCKGEGDGRIYP